MTWYELDHARLVIERSKVSAGYPEFVLKRAGNGILYWLGKIELSVGTIRPPALQLRIEYPEGFPAIYPDAFVIEPTLPEDHVGHKWHRWPTTGTICYVKPKSWQLGTTADNVISKCEDWYFNYIAVTNGLIEEMPDVGRAVLKG
jgi:hypothetical protein